MAMATTFARMSDADLSSYERLFMQMQFGVGCTGAVFSGELEAMRRERARRNAPPEFHPGSHHARMLACAASSRRQIMSGRTIFDRAFLLAQARNCIAGARDCRENGRKG